MVARSSYRPQPNSLDNLSVSRRIKKWASFANSNEHLFFAVCLRDSVIGYIALNQRQESYEIGYCFHSDYHGNGYAKESIYALLEMMRAQGVSRIVAGTALKNMPSVKLLLSLGFKQVGLEDQSFYQDADGKAVVFEGGINEVIVKGRKKR